MREARLALACTVLSLVAALAGPAAAQPADPLPSWNAGAARQSIVDFVAAKDTGALVNETHSSAGAKGRAHVSERLHGEPAASVRLPAIALTC